MSRILKSTWPLNVAKNFDKKQISFVATRELPQISHKFQSEIHKYKLCLSDKDITFTLDSEVFELLYDLVLQTLHSIKEHYSEQDQKQIYAQANLTLNGLHLRFIKSGVFQLSTANAKQMVGLIISKLESVLTLSLIHI